MTRNDIESKIGYVFKDEALLKRAFTHGSADGDPARNYQSLEFLGDSIVDFVIAKKLLELYPDSGEGELTKLRANIVSEHPLAVAAGRLGIADFLTVGAGEKRDDISSRESIRSDLFEALTAAVYLDSGSMEAAENFVLSALGDIVKEATAEDGNNLDAKSVLNEYAFKRGAEAEYREEAKSGPQHNPVFVYSVWLSGERLGQGEGKSKKEAQQNAAKDALERLGKQTAHR